MFIREFHYIYNSKTDLVDLWIGLTTILLGCHFILFEPMEIQPYYQYFLNKEYSSIGFGSALILFGTLSIICVFLPFKPNAILVAIVKSLKLFSYLFLLFGIAQYNFVPPVLVFYLMMPVLIVENMFRTPN